MKGKEVDTISVISAKETIRNFWQPAMEAKGAGGLVTEREKPVWLGYQIEYLQCCQHNDRDRLKRALEEGDGEEVKKVRDRLYQRRKGPKGLRALHRMAYRIRHGLES